MNLRMEILASNYVMKIYYNGEKKLKIKLIEWIIKTFGEPKHGNLLNFSEQVSELQIKKEQFMITEIKISFLTRHIDMKLINQENFKKWKEEVNELTENSIRKFHCDDSDIYHFEAVPNETKQGKSFLLLINIFHKQEI